VAILARVECRCADKLECPANLTKIEGTGVLQQPEGCDLFIEELMLLASRQFESRAKWSGPEVVVPQIPDLLHPREVAYIREHQEVLEDIWDDWQIPEEGPAPVIAPMTMSELRQQMEGRTQRRKWIVLGAVIGAIAVAAIVFGQCLWRYRQTVFSIRAWFSRGRTVAGNTESTQARREDEPTEITDSEAGPVPNQRTVVVFQ
jgi:hypothetical protein